MNTPHLWLAVCMLFLASTVNTLKSQPVDVSTAPVLIQLDFPLSQNTLAQLRAEGIELLHHYGEGAYLATSVPSGAQHIDPTELPQTEATVLRLFEGIQPLGDTRIDVDLVFAFRDASAYLYRVLAEAAFIPHQQQIEHGRTLSGSLTIDALQSLLEHPYILDATPCLLEVEPYNFEARIVQSVTPLNSGIPGAPNLNGRGIVIGVGDGGTLAGHPDMGERVLYTTENYNAGWGNHPDMVSGIIAGAGNVFSSNRGVASEAELIVETNSAITYYAPTYLQDYGMTITNNSYGPSFHCNTANQYFGNSASTDQQLYDNPSLLHVFAVGNSGSSSCPDIPSGYSTIPGGPQNAKNTLSVGNVNFQRLRYRTSSAGPTKDGRLKPEISAVGTAITTTVRNGRYGTGTGTSFAAPNVASTLALLSEAFQRKNPGVTPPGALLKAIACNTADDAGRSGPDFEYGFGILNAYNALQVIDAEQFERGTISANEDVRKEISVEEGTPELKVMLYWNDLAGSTSNEQSVLVNDLDLLLVSEDGTTSYPLVLDQHDPTADAHPGEDHVNNIEQVTLKNPAAGNYHIVVRASTLSYGSGNYVITWYTPQPEVVLTCPYGGESIVPRQSTYISWTATTGDQGTWTVEFSEDSNQWQTIATEIPGGDRSISWSAPGDISQAEFRITNPEIQLSDQTNAPVTMLTPPQHLTATELCATRLQFSWSPQETAARYAVYRFDGEQMRLVGSTTDTLWVFDDLHVDEKLLLSVATLTEANQSSKRAFALQTTHSGLGPACVMQPIVQWGELSTEELGEAVRITWDVDREQRTQRFELERGLVQRDALQWTYVDAVLAQGTSSTTITYETNDNGAALEGLTYYRVRMVADDGKAYYSPEFSHLRDSLPNTPVVSTTAIPAPEKAPSFTLIQNPVGETIRIRSQRAKSQTLFLYDSIGRRRGSFRLRSGTNQFPWPKDLGAGLYVLRVADKNSTRAVKLIRR